MASSGFGESTSKPPQSPSCSNNGNNDAGSFECNICFDLAQDPIVTLCGHLFCWPCLYKWLHIHSQCQECPVCKALIQEEKLVPLYGRGKTPTDPRSKSIPGINIPNRPAGQRPGTAPPPDPNHFPHNGFGFMGGFAPMATARLGNFTLSAAFGGLIPSLFNLQVHGFPDTTMYGSTPGFPYGFSNSFHGGHAHGFPQPTSQGQQADSYLKMMFLMVMQAHDRRCQGMRCFGGLREISWTCPAQVLREGLRSSEKHHLEEQLLTGTIERERLTLIVTTVN